MADTCKIIKDYGVVADHDGKQLKLQLVSWYGNEPKYDLRPWSGDYGMKGMVFEEDTLRNLQKVLHEFCDSHPVEEKSNVKTLTSLPATDCNFSTALNSATTEELEKAIEQMKDKPGNKTRISSCEKALKKAGSKTTKTQETRAVEAPVEEKKPEEKKVVQFPQAKPEIIKLDSSNGSHTYGECVVKLKKEMEQFTDSDSQYVIEGLLELCKVDADFRNNVMREDKTYGGFMEYMYKAAQSGYCVRYGNVGWLDRDKGLGLAIDYYTADIEKMEAEEQKRREEKRKEEEKKSVKTKNNGRKKKRTA